MKKLSTLCLLLLYGCAAAPPAAGPEPAGSTAQADPRPAPPPVPALQPGRAVEVPPAPADPLSRAVYDVRAALAGRDLAGAEEAAGRVLALGGNRPEYLTLAGVVAHARRDLPLAGERLGRALAIDPDFRDALVLRGVVGLGLGNYREAAADFARVLAQPVAEDRIVDLALARARYRELVEREKLAIDFDEAVSAGLLPVDAPAMYARWYGRLAARLIAAGAGLEQRTVASEHYSLVTDLPEPMADYLLFHLELAHSAYRQLLGGAAGSGGPHKLRARLFSDPIDYRRFLREVLEDPGVPEFAAGSYHPLTRELVLAAGPETDRTIGVIFHEGFHQYLDEFLRDPPPWFGEGIADYFGGGRVEGNRLLPGGPNRERILDLERAIGASSPVDLDALIAMTQPEFLATGARSFARRKALVKRNYALSWAFVHFLLDSDQGARREILLRYFREMRAGADPETAAARAFGPGGAKGLLDAFTAHARELARVADR